MKTEEEAETIGGVGEVGLTMVATSGESEGSGSEEGQGGAEAGKGVTLDTTSEDADAAVARGHHGEKKGKGRGLPAGRKTRPAIPLQWGSERGGQRPLEWLKTPGGTSR